MDAGRTLLARGADAGAEKEPVVPSTIAAGGDTVAVRIPDHPIAGALIRSLGNPLVGTSANISGGPSPVTAEQVYAQLKGQVDFIIDGGECPGGIESTVVDLCGETPVVLREGLISLDMLSEVCGAIIWKPETG